MDATRPITVVIPATRIMRALLDRARLCSREAGLKGNEGPGLTDFRAMLRAETEACNGLAAMIMDMDPAILNALNVLLNPEELTMPDHENELIIGIGRDGKPVKVLVIEDEAVRIWAEDANAQSGHGKSNLIGSRLRELIAAGRHDSTVFDAKAPGPESTDPR